MPWSPLPTSDRRGGGPDPARLPELLDAVLAGIGGPTVEAIVVLHERWAELVGPEVADRSRPLGVEAGTLKIAADSAAWASHLRWSEADVIERAAALLGPGTVTAIVVRVARN